MATKIKKIKKAKKFKINKKVLYTTLPNAKEILKEQEELLKDSEDYRLR